MLLPGGRTPLRAPTRPVRSGTSTRRPVCDYGIGLCARYAKPGTELAYGATKRVRLVQGCLSTRSGRSLRLCS
eukprot:903573-Rhodomonas_salina.1